MLMSSERGFLFIHIPKTAGSSLTRALEPYADKVARTPYRRLLSHLPVAEAANRASFGVHAKAAWIRMKMGPDAFESLFKFAVVRNPYDYAVSYYAYVRQSPTSRRSADANRWSFLEFLHYFERKQRFGGSMQSRWVTDRSGRVIVDELLRFETLASDFPALLRRLGIDEKTALPHVNSSKRADYRAMYGPEERRIADRVFRRDLELFGYDF